MTKTLHEIQKPIFIHSLFRSGSTYIFNTFRRSKSNYCCYQEPLNEYLYYAKTEPDKLLDMSKETQEYLRHPKLEKPYFYEFHKVVDDVAKSFHKKFSYDQYFPGKSDEVNDLKLYFTALINGVQEKQTVFQCCRTTGRVANLKSELDGIHIFLWRNPWDQWWSYKKTNYFDVTNLLIFNAINIRSFLMTLKNELEIPSFHDKNTLAEYEFYGKHRLSSVNSYKVFYALWCHAILEAKPFCDLSISIDQLTLSDTYRKEILEKLEQFGISGVDYSDCSMPMTSYGASDGDFFIKIENYIHELLLSHGYSCEQVDEIILLSEKRKTLLVDTNLAENSFVRDAMRAREYFQQAETDFSEAQRCLSDTETRAQQAEVKTQQAEAKAQQAEAKAQQAEAKAQQTEAKAQQAEARVQAIEKSLSWKITAPLRWFGSFLLETKRKDLQLFIKKLTHKNVVTDTTTIKELSNLTPNARNIYYELKGAPKKQKRGD